MEPGYAFKVCKLQNLLTDKKGGQPHKYIFIMILDFQEAFHVPIYLLVSVP